MASDAAKEFHSRGFLNQDKGMAAYEYKAEWYHTNFSFASFSISDCNRVVNLDFDFKNEKDKLDKQYKLDTLITQLKQFRDEVFT